MAGDSLFTFFSLRPCWRKALYNTSEPGDGLSWLSFWLFTLAELPKWSESPIYEVGLLFCRSGIINSRFGACLSNHSAFCLFKVPHSSIWTKWFFFCLIFGLLPKLDQCLPQPKHWGESINVGACVTTYVLRFFTSWFEVSLYGWYHSFENIYCLGFFASLPTLPLSSHYFDTSWQEVSNVKPHGFAEVL